MAYTTRASLLSRVCKGDEVSWDEFYKTYQPLFYHLGRNQFHLNDHDIKDVIQEVMLCFFGQSTEFKYDRSKGLLRGYLKKIFHFKVLQFNDRLRRKQTEVPVEDEDLDLLAEPEDSDFDKAWNSEWRKFVIDQSLHDLKETVEPQTFQIFHHLVIEEIPPQEVADAFQTTVNNVYAIKSRLAKKVSDHAREYMDECVNF